MPEKFSTPYKSLPYFSEIVAADARRKEFDIKNHSILRTKKTPTFLFIGDSITQYWELNAYFDTTNNLIINRGIAGDTTTYLRQRFAVDALQLNPQYCILGIGINDSIQLEGDYWKLIPPIPYEDILYPAQRNIEDIILQAQESSTLLILTTLLPIAIPILQHEDMRRQYIWDMNQWLLSKAEQYKLPIINYYTALTYPGANKPLDNITIDGLHPNANGYEIMALLVKNTLSKHNILI
ncbi:MAG: SGNH/GDSL hydrolase family protein [Eubacteriales bacterium]